MEKYNRVRNLEKEHRWKEAAELWRVMGYHEDADACQMIHDANTKGDEYRAEVERTIGDEPELSPGNIPAWQLWHQELGNIYKKYFKHGSGT